jgi:rRNA processing protein Krr1/Pno1
MYYEIKWKSGRIITNATTVEKAIENFKKLKIEVPDKEISISKFGK